jgi:hypothetical protein
MRRWGALVIAGCSDRAQRAAGRTYRQRGEPQTDRKDGEALSGDHYDGKCDQRDRRYNSSNSPGHAASGEDVPRGDHCDSE